LFFSGKGGFFDRENVWRYSSGYKLMKRIDFTNTQVASSQTARDINRSVVLNFIRRGQPISRADLARVSGLQRSTVSLITEQLIRERWVVHGPIGRLPRGRRPRFLRLNDLKAILVADLRPDQIRVGVADVNGNFLSQEIMPTPNDAPATATGLAERILHLMDVHSELVFEGVGISLPGRVSAKTQHVIFAPNLRWPDFDLKGAIQKATGLRVELENAANACALAEVWFGPAEKIRDLVVVTVSEGLGTGIFLNGQLVRGRDGMAGEFGHVPLDVNGPACSCGGRGCWEVYGSNRAALRYYRELSATKDELSFQDLLALAEARDESALKALERMFEAIGRGMRMIVTGLAPHEIVVVGEVTRQWHRFGSLIEKEVGMGFLAGRPPRVRPALGEMARLRGTVALVLQKHFGPSAGAGEEEEEGPRPGNAIAP
jgi:predicted NBD/HSP70 family sugar kinase